MEPHLGVRHVLEAGDRAHVHLAAFLLVAAVATGCGGHGARAFCGLSRTVNGFDYVAATDVACTDALRLVPRFERGDRGAWGCSRSVGGDVELSCRRGRATIDLLERSPVAARRRGNVVVLANVTFRLGRGVLGGRGPWCVPDVPREVLRAFRLRPLTRAGGCFGRRP